MSQLSARAAAARLGVAYSTLKRWIHAGHVRTMRTSGGHHRIAEAELERLLAQRPSLSKVAAGPRDDDGLGGLSARNRLRGVIEEVRVDGLLAQVRLRVAGQPLTAIITADAVRALGLRRGDEALAVVKSTEVMVARAPRSAPASPPGRRPLVRERAHA